jgi:SAM-dependent methyltransferase
MGRFVSSRVRRTVFGRDPAGYERARLGYPEALWRTLARRCGLRPGAAVFEIGPGTGKATRELVRRRVDPLTLVEPDPRFVRYLRRRLRPGRREIQFVARHFESARLPAGSFDLGLAATSFHWLPPRRAYRKVARLLRPGGWFISFNNRHGDPFRPSRFQAELHRLYRRIYGDPGGVDEPRARFVRERTKWQTMLRSLRAFDRIEFVDLHWSVTLSTNRVVALWATFSEIATLPVVQRRHFLDALAEMVDLQFGGRVTLHMLTPVRMVRRTSRARRRSTVPGRPSRAG